MSEQQTPKPKSKTANLPSQRLPAPSLFVGPPSRNASNLSIARPPPTTKDQAWQSGQKQSSSAEASPVQAKGRDRAQTTSSSDSWPQQYRAGGYSTRPLKPRPSKAAVDAQWVDLQSTLADIELSAAGTAQIFGPAHAAALEDLRKAQIALAKAWEPGADASIEQSKDADEEKNSGKGDGKDTAAKDKQADKPKGRNQRESENGQDADRGHGEADLTAAAARTKANEEYFLKIKSGVQDVVAKLETVSNAMRRVEVESREIWGEGESLASVDSKGAE